MLLRPWSVQYLREASFRTDKAQIWVIKTFLLFMFWFLSVIVTAWEALRLSINGAKDFNTGRISCFSKMSSGCDLSSSWIKQTHKMDHINICNCFHKNTNQPSIWLLTLFFHEELGPSEYLHFPPCGSRKEVRRGGHSCQTVWCNLWSGLAYIWNDKDWKFQLFSSSCRHSC